MHKQGRPTPEGCAAHLKSFPLMAAPGSRSNTCAPAARLARTGGMQHHRHASIRQKMPTRQEMPFCAPSTDPTAETDPVPTLGGYCLLGSPLGLVTAGEGLGRDAVAGPHAPGCPGVGGELPQSGGDGLADFGAGVFLGEMDAGRRAGRSQHPDRTCAGAGRSACPARESGGSPGRGDTPGRLGQAERPGIGGAGLRREAAEAAAVRRPRRPGPAGPLPGRCRRSR